MKYYTGIGSRETPEAVIVQMLYIANKLALEGYTLYSGGADGADTAFEIGAMATGRKCIFLPWKGFNHDSQSRTGLSDIGHIVLDSLPQKIQHEAWEIASRLIPHWNALTIGGKKLHTRNVFQILGHDLKTPTEFVVCWTKDGALKGGTATAIKLATERGIPVFNLYTKMEVEGLF